MEKWIFCNIKFTAKNPFDLLERWIEVVNFLQERSTK